LLERIDDGGRVDEGRVGDLTVEARAAGLSGMLVWGSYRDTSELAAVGLPSWSYGAFPAGPRRLDPRPPDPLARVGEVVADAEDAVVADADGAVSVCAALASDVLAAARRIAAQTERGQAGPVAGGRTLREQIICDASAAPSGRDEGRNRGRNI
jgi:4-hydroxy-4-methyl-2-oxoglutarate aldolase